MPLYKILISIFAVILTFVAYVPYIQDIIKKKTTPHAFTWFIFTLAGSIACGLQIFGGAGHARHQGTGQPATCRTGADRCLSAALDSRQD